MKKVVERIAFWGLVAAAALGIGYCVLGAAVSVRTWIRAPAAAREYYEAPCTPLPAGFQESDLVGSWTGIYFGDVDKLVIRADGTYQQIHTGNADSESPLKFVSPWNRWTLEYRPNGNVRLHLRGMRRCDSVESICNNPGGGLPPDLLVIDECDAGPVDQVGEVILAVAGTRGNAPRGIVLWQLRCCGDEFLWGYELQE